MKLQKLVLVSLLCIWPMAMSLANDLPIKAIRYQLSELDAKGKRYPIWEGNQQIIDVEAQLHLSIQPRDTLEREGGWDYYPRLRDRALSGELEVSVKAVVEQANGKVINLHVNGFDLLQNKQLELIWQPLDDQKDVYINMDSSVWQDEDRLSITLLLRYAGSTDIIDEITYFMKADMIGLYNLFSTGMVFSQPLDTPDAPWKSNIMTQVNWYYDYRNPTKAGSAWNWLGIGAGLHLASLDHSNDNNVEFGIGGNIAIWEGLLSFGMGYNLSVDEDRTYKFVTIDLFDLLDGKKGN